MSIRQDGRGDLRQIDVFPKGAFSTTGFRRAFLPIAGRDIATQWVRISGDTGAAILTIRTTCAPIEIAEAQFQALNPVLSIPENSVFQPNAGLVFTSQPLAAVENSSRVVEKQTQALTAVLLEADISAAFLGEFRWFFSYTKVV